MTCLGISAVFPPLAYGATRNVYEIGATTGTTAASGWRPFGETVMAITEIHSYWIALFVGGPLRV